MASILFSIRPDDGRPVYRQIVDQVMAALGSGKLRPGDQLPTHRDLARELVVAPLTVKKAYDTLQAEGLILMANRDAALLLEKVALLTGPRGVAARVLLALFGRDAAMGTLRAG